MKKMICWMLVLVALTGGALAEAGWIGETETVQMDLNGDGVQEELAWFTTAVNEYEEMVTVTVNTPDGNMQWGVPLYGVEVYADDLNGDGVTEIFVSGDVMSDDYITYCLQFDGVGMMQLDFADVDRGENDGVYENCGYGRLVCVKDNTIELAGSQDILGTYMASRVLALQNGRFEIADDGIWRVEVDTERFEWEYAHLKAVQDVPVVFTTEAGEEEGVLHAGEKALISGGDKVEKAYFVTEDGRTGYFRVEPDTVNGWGSLVGGIPEAELFECVPYAD